MVVWRLGFGVVGWVSRLGFRGEGTPILLLGMPDLGERKGERERERERKREGEREREKERERGLP